MKAYISVFAVNKMYVFTINKMWSKFDNATPA